MARISLFFGRVALSLVAVCRLLRSVLCIPDVMYAHIVSRAHNPGRRTRNNENGVADDRLA
ncbi:hypothetical protein FB466_2284 [Klugiella xanthotipulae]|uniref:Uncharacterized protein n=1 Tax=Klugiella xanthotipulae TaxID=244735 RepID=A0A543HSU5_9MICO|nr:hypothetical protein FB466_2284 [Klugiella xanthotipulae]